MSKVKGVRFSASEEAQIEEFLKKNSFLDFSTLAKIAILEFVKNPQINLIAVNSDLKKEVKNARSSLRN